MAWGRRCDFEVVVVVGREQTLEIRALPFERVVK